MSTTEQSQPTPPLPEEVEAALLELRDCWFSVGMPLTDSQVAPVEKLRAHLRQQAERIGELRERVSELEPSAPADKPEPHRQMSSAGMIVCAILIGNELLSFDLTSSKATICGNLHPWEAEALAKGILLRVEWIRAKMRAAQGEPHRE